MRKSAGNYAYLFAPGSPVTYDGKVGEGALLQGQNNPNPYASFHDHVVVMIKSPDGTVRYYDPSYGTSYGTLLELQKGSIAGFFSEALYEKSGYTQVSIRKPGPGLELQDTVIPLPKK
jgi:hypothetical protein